MGFPPKEQVPQGTMRLQKRLCERNDASDMMWFNHDISKQLKTVIDMHVHDLSHFSTARPP
jgi:hypothetical protein